jgi:soluble cytochrome b562
MKYRSLASSLPLILLLGATVAQAQDAAAPAPADASAPAAAPKPEKTALAKDMDKMNRAFRKLRTQITDATKNDASLALVATMHDAATAAANETPAKAADLPAADQAKFNSDFQSKMQEFLTALDKVTADLKSGDNATAATDVKALGGLERDDHKQFRKPEKE